MDNSNNQQSKIMSASNSSTLVLERSPLFQSVTLAILLIAAITPFFTFIQPPHSVLLISSLCVYLGSLRSVKQVPPEESLSTKDALKFPLIGSAVLFGLFIVFKLIPSCYLNLIVSFYFGIVGLFAITLGLKPTLDLLVPSSLQMKQKLLKFRLPLFSDVINLTLDTSYALGSLIGLIVSIWYVLSGHWLANNFMGLAFALEGIEHFSLGSCVTGCILLGGLFFYDIFWVFFTPVMVTVARSFEAPIKLLFPRDMEFEEFSMLGLGDIVIPGVFVALILRFDVANSYKSKYFRSALFGYVLGIIATLAVMIYFQTAQPALLYLVPSVIGSVAIHSYYNKEFQKVFAFDETAKSVNNSTKNA